MMDTKNFVLKGDICYSLTSDTLCMLEPGFLVCLEGKSAGVFPKLPEAWAGLPRIDYSGALILPGLTDLHMHAPQYSFRSLGMDLELLAWLQSRAFPEEAKYTDAAYAHRAYTALAEDLKKGPNTRICLFATLHTEASMILMDLLEESGLVTMVGKVNMDRNSPDILREADAAASLAATRLWLEQCGAYRNCSPILTPRFIPSCSNELLGGLGELRKERGLPVQSHLSENQQEIAWVRELCPQSPTYAGAYGSFGLLGERTIMAHCVWSGEEEIALLKKEGVYIAHCPQSNTNLSSGIAPARRFLEAGLSLGLGSDVAGGVHSSVFRAMTDAIQVSKLRQCLVNRDEKALTLEEAFYLGTAGGGAFFGKAGSFEPGYELDALVIDDASLAAPFPLTVRERLERVVYLSDDRHIKAKYVRGKRIR
jgi:guanine deaminase